ncbi:conjugal transfer/type IV secretion protein DotA/TraY [Rhodoblastus acidophilus]|nr:hypothetical protein [Rhodoblastus acidophilus]MCW2319134.1 conjugal transfer/type IV secretion protein DotA/TraY [Rhodoblastus acidophilus]
MLNSLVNNLSPTSSQWNDPFGGLIALGNKMTLAALAILGAAAALTTTVGQASAVAGGVASCGITGGLAAAGASSVINFLSTPIFAGASVFLAQGQMIAYVLPMIPWVIWMAGVAGYRASQKDCGACELKPQCWPNNGSASPTGWRAAFPIIAIPRASFIPAPT